MQPLIALITDFGLADWYVAAMKGEIVRRLATAGHAPTFIDISHMIPPQNIEVGAFQLRCVLPSLPEGTIVVGVIDPGVGTSRRAMCGRIGAHGWSGPDNGLATPLLEIAGSNFALHEIQAPEFCAARVCDTFHGRDLFATAAAALAAGAPPGSAGPAVTNPARLPNTEPQELARGLRARVMLIDHFGNLVTNLRREAHEEALAKRRYQIIAGNLRIGMIHRTFAQVHNAVALAYWGSAGTLEIGVNLGSAAQTTGLKIGDPIQLEWLE